MKSENIGELAKALSLAQLSILPAHKDSSNPFFKSKYADLNSIWASIKKPLAENGLAISQATELNGSTLVLVTILMHTSGQWISGEYPINPVKNDPQSMGSALSYAKRYCLAAIVGVVSSDEDDDGNAASQPAIKKEAVLEKIPTKPAAKQVPVAINANEFDFKVDLKQMNSSANCTPAQAQLIRTRMGVLGWDKFKQERFLTHIGCKNKDGVVSATLLMKDSINQILNYLDIQKGLTPS